MYQSNIKESGHVWQKQNLVTKSGRKGHYDEMICSNCNMKGRRYNFESVEISETYKMENAFSCPKSKPIDLPKSIRVIRCTAFGSEFSNLTPNSVHEIVTPPQGYKNDAKGVWVMGVSEPVKLLSNEFQPI